MGEGDSCMSSNYYPSFTGCEYDGGVLSESDCHADAGMHNRYKCRGLFLFKSRYMRFCVHEDVAATR